MSNLFHIFDAMLGAVLLLIAVLAPWMLGSTTTETIWALNSLGFLSGGLRIARCAIRSTVSGGRQPPCEYSRADWQVACVWGVGDDFTLLRVDQCFESQSPSSVHLYSGVFDCFRRRGRLPRPYRAVAQVP